MYLTKDGIELHDGHWYTTSTPIRGAHCTPDGRPVMVFCQPDRPLVGQIGPDGKSTMVRGPKRPARFVVQAPDGHDLFEWDTSNPHQPVQQFAIFPVGQLADIQPLVEADHLPDSRKAHLEPGTKLVHPDNPNAPIVQPSGFERFLASIK